MVPESRASPQCQICRKRWISCFKKKIRKRDGFHDITATLRVDNLLTGSNFRNLLLSLAKLGLHCIIPLLLSSVNHSPRGSFFGILLHTSPLVLRHRQEAAMTMKQGSRGVSMKPIRRQIEALSIFHPSKSRDSPSLAFNAQATVDA